ncbi:hypothetical protein [Enterococcus rotai]|uniref:hypothetical protein n=1 Tax=Enterococcus rotai TaxID=118060 RepID=UPI0032B5CBC8
MYANLETVMKEKGLGMKDIAGLFTNDENYFFIISKLEENAITYDEALLIREEFFSEYSLEFLFQ